MTAHPAADQLLDVLRRALGPESGRAQPGGGETANMPAVLVSPGSAAEVAACLRVARDQGAAVLPRGGGTLQRLGFPPERADICLDCGRLSGVIDWEPADLTAGILAGTTLAAVEAELEQHGQQLAIDAPVAERATIGGLVAANVCGPRRWLYGGWRDQIIGMEMALSSGEVIKSGGRVVKNVQGYDLGKLFTGALGTLGVITRVNVKLAPLPRARRLLMAQGELDGLGELLAEVAASTLRVATLDLLDPDAAEACGLPTGRAAALLLIEGTAALVDGQAVKLERMASERGLRTESVDGAESARIYARRVNLDRIDDLAGDEAVVRVTVLPERAAGVIAMMRRATEQFGLAACCWAEAGTGAVSMRVRGSARDFGRTMPELQRRLMANVPATSVVCADPALQQALQPWGAEPDGLELMRRLKHRFDPTRTLQPGRYVGRI